MKRSFPFLCLLLFISLTAGCKKNISDGRVNILILSGQNNHEWQKTTPLLVRIFREAMAFNISVTEEPDTLSYDDLRRFNVIVSNWNTWPDNDLRLSRQWEEDFEKYIKKGGGAVFIHAGASSFYGWENYHRTGIGRWGKATHHGKPSRAKITGFDNEHPITKGFSDFHIMDELWENADIHPEARVLAYLTGTDENGNEIREGAVFINQFGKGRSFYTILGHDERALLNSGLQTLIVRGTLWTARHELSSDIPNELRNDYSENQKPFSFESTDTTFSLKKGNGIIWQFNFNNRYGKQYFHPVNALSSELTCVSPPDHPWHMGLWFSWKFINGINYWEYLDDYKSEETGFLSAGTTIIQKSEIKKNHDFSAALSQNVLYQQLQGEPVMSEKSNINISAPSGDGSYFIDFDKTFNAIADEVILDRTPITGEPEGQSWGGYSGLSVRFNQDFTLPEIIGPDSADNYKKNRWIYMGFNTLKGETAGMSIMINPEFTTEQTSWYIINNPDIPFYYYSPAVIFDGKIILKKGEGLRLKYRVWIIPGKADKSDLELKYESYVNE